MSIHGYPPRRHQVWGGLNATPTLLNANVIYVSVKPEIKTNKSSNQTYETNTESSFSELLCGE